MYFLFFHMKYQYIISTQYLYYKLASKNMSVECKFITVQNNIGVLGGVGAGGALTPPGKNILLGRTELGGLAVGPETSRGFYEYSSLLCLLVTALSLTTTAGSDKLKEFARVGIFSTAITKFI